MSSYLEKRIDYWMSQLKDELKDKFVYVYRQERRINAYTWAQADMNPNLKPMLLTFYLRTMHFMVKKHIDDYVKAVIRHEIAHLFTPKESEANSKGENFLIFKDE